MTNNGISSESRPPGGQVGDAVWRGFRRGAMVPIAMIVKTATGARRPAVKPVAQQVRYSTYAIFLAVDSLQKQRAENANAIYG
jgi:hypothetical protein